MINYENAENLRKYYITHESRKTVINMCSARKNWNGCDYCDVYAGSGLPCWKQDGKHNCCHCTEIKK